MQKIVLITGAGRPTGLGFNTARLLAQQGYNVILTARQAGQAQARAEELRAEGLDVTPLDLDIADAESVRQAVEFVQQTYGKLDVLVNNAAIMAVTPVLDFRTDLDFVQNQFNTNLIGTWRMAQEFYPLLKAAGKGRVVNVSSSAGSYWESGFGLVNNPGLEMRQFGEDVPIGSYSLTKLAINGLTLKLAQDFKKDGISVNAVCPGLVETYPPSPGRSPEEGARSIVWAVTQPDDNLTAGFFRDGKRLPW